MATLNIGIKIAYSNSIFGSHLASTSGIVYTVGAGQYAEADVLCASGGPLGPTNQSYLWLGSLDANNRSRGFGTPTTLSVMEAGQIVGNVLVPTPGLINTKTYLAAGQNIGWRAGGGGGMVYEVSIRGFVNTL